MSKNPILRHFQWLDNMIAEHEKAIARLVIAREVLLEADHDVMKPPPEKELQRAVGKLVWHGKPAKPDKRSSDMLRRHIIATLTAAHPLKSNQIFERLPEGTNIKRMWNVIYNMKAKGLVERLPDGSYQLPPITANRPADADNNPADYSS